MVVLASPHLALPGKSDGLCSHAFLGNVERHRRIENGATDEVKLFFQHRPPARSHGAER
jgi:hypothetical protein